MHPSHKRAYEILACRHEQEAEHQRWRDQHHPEELLPTSSPRQLKRKDYNGDLLYRTTETPLPATTNDASWNEWFAASFDARINDVIDGIGAGLAEITKQMSEDFSSRLDELETRLDELESRVADLEGNSKSGSKAKRRSGR
jgi:hypothetical protein